MRFTSHSLLAVLVLSIAAFGQSINLDTQVKGSRLPMWGVDSGSANAYAIATIGALGPSLRTGSRFAFIATHANTTASTLAVDGGSTIAIKKNVSAALVSGDIALNQVIEVTYDGTNFQLVGPGALTFTSIGGTLGCSQLPTFTGDVTNSSCAMTLASVVTAGSCGDSTHSCGLTYDAKGRITAATNNTISGGGGGGGGQWPLVSFTDPTTPTWSWVNQTANSTTATITSGTGTGGNNYLILTEPGNSQRQGRLRVKTIPSCPYTVTMAEIWSFTDNVTFQEAGMVLYDSASTKLVYFTVIPENAAVPDFGAYKQNSPSSFNATYKEVVDATTATPVLWMQLKDDCTTRFMNYSHDGITFQKFFSVGHTDFVTPNQIGFFVDSNSTSNPVSNTILSWVETSP